MNKKIVTCPFCGRTLLRTKVAEIDMQCPKCRKKLLVSCMDKGILVKEETAEEYDAAVQ